MRALVVRRCAGCGKTENQVPWYPRTCKTNRCMECSRAYQREKYASSRPALTVVRPSMPCAGAEELGRLTDAWGVDAPHEWRSMVR